MPSSSFAHSLRPRRKSFVVTAKERTSWRKELRSIEGEIGVAKRNYASEFTDFGILWKVKTAIPGLEDGRDFASTDNRRRCYVTGIGTRAGAVWGQLIAQYSGRVPTTTGETRRDFPVSLALSLYRCLMAFSLQRLSTIETNEVQLRCERFKEAKFVTEFLLPRDVSRMLSPALQVCSYGLSKPVVTILKKLEVGSGVARRRGIDTTRQLKGKLRVFRVLENAAILGLTDVIVTVLDAIDRLEIPFDSLGYKIIQLATYCGNHSTVRCVLQHRTTTVGGGGGLVSPTHQEKLISASIRLSEWNILRMLIIEGGLDASASSSTGTTSVLGKAVSRGAPPSIVRMLVERCGMSVLPSQKIVDSDSEFEKMCFNSTAHFLSTKEETLIHTAIRGGCQLETVQYIFDRFVSEGEARFPKVNVRRCLFNLFNLEESSLRIEKMGERKSISASKLREWTPSADVNLRTHSLTDFTGRYDVLHVALQCSAGLPTLRFLLEERTKQFQQLMTTTAEEERDWLSHDENQLLTIQADHAWLCRPCSEDTYRLIWSFVGVAGQKVALLGHPERMLILAVRNECPLSIIEELRREQTPSFEVIQPLFSNFPRMSYPSSRSDVENMKSGGPKLSTNDHDDDDDSLHHRNRSSSIPFVEDVLDCLLPGPAAEHDDGSDHHHPIYGEIAEDSSRARASQLFDYSENRSLLASICQSSWQSQRAVLLIRYLVKEKGLPINDAKSRMGTALHYATRYGTPDVMRCLLDLGANPTIRNSRGDVPLVYCTDKFIRYQSSTVVNEIGSQAIRKRKFEILSQAEREKDY